MLDVLALSCQDSETEIEAPAAVNEKAKEYSKRNDQVDDKQDENMKLQTLTNPATCAKEIFLQRVAKGI